MTLREFDGEVEALLAKVAAFRPCKPHRWRQPQPTDRVLRCRVCGRELELATLEPWRRASIVRAFETRLGRHAAADFNAAIAAAQRAA